MSATRVHGLVNTGAVTMVVMDCASCGVVFAVTANYDQRRRSDGCGFRCPNGHSNTYGETDIDRERKRAEVLQRRLSWAEGNNIHLKDQLKSTEYQRRAAKGQLTKVRKRVAAGVCPCCTRSFANLAAHMAGQHPDYPAGD